MVGHKSVNANGNKGHGGRENTSYGGTVIWGHGAVFIRVGSTGSYMHGWFGYRKLIAFIIN